MKKADVPRSFQLFFYVFSHTARIIIQNIFRIGEFFKLYNCFIF